MSDSIIREGTYLLIFGMGTVFVFLTLLVGATNCMSRLVQRFLPEPVPPSQAAAPQPNASASVEDPRLLAILQAAVDQHRSRKK